MNLVWSQRQELRLLDETADLKRQQGRENQLDVRSNNDEKRNPKEKTT